jgi:hypothetical protein
VPGLAYTGSELSVATYKLEVMPEVWDSTTEVGNIPTGKTGVNYISWDSITKKYPKREGGRTVVIN